MNPNVLKHYIINFPKHNKWIGKACIMKENVAMYNQEVFFKFK